MLGKLVVEVEHVIARDTKDVAHPVRVELLDQILANRERCFHMPSNRRYHPRGNGSKPCGGAGGPEVLLKRNLPLQRLEPLERERSPIQSAKRLLRWWTSSKARFEVGAPRPGTGRAPKNHPLWSQRGLRPIRQPSQAATAPTTHGVKITAPSFTSTLESLCRNAIASGFLSRSLRTFSLCTFC